VKKIRREEDLIKIASKLMESGYELDNMWVKIKIPSYNLKKLDQYMFKKFNPGKVYLNETVPNEEVFVNIGGIQFELTGDGKYTLNTEKDEEGNEFVTL
jgi:hypothetical protein